MQLPSHPTPPTRIYADGVYDVFHIGHARQLEQAKKGFKSSHIIVGVSGQEETERLKGKTLMNETERSEAVINCKWVDEVICPCPWVLTKQFLDDLELDYVAHDALPYASGGSGDIYKEVKELGKFFETKRTDGVSTSDLIVRIIKNRERFYNQLLKQGYKRSALGLGVFDYVGLKWNSLCLKIFGCQKRKKEDKGNKKDK